MKKFWTLLCMIACIFGLTACGSEEKLTEFEQQKVDLANYRAAETFVPMLAGYQKDAMFDELTSEEVEYMIGSQYSVNVDGAAFAAALDSFQSAMETVGEITEIKASNAEIDGKQIIVNVEVSGSKKDAIAEIIFSNDLFMTLESASLNPVSSMSELMAKAALNTLIGMGTVFAVLILISFIISGFRIIPKIQEKAAKKKESQVVETGVDNALARIVEQEAVVEESDDLELVAVIAAAVAASEGAASVDGYVVRSIRRR